MKKSAFTLIELLIIIVIVGVITSMTFISLNGTRAKSRDTKRISDIRQLQSALEMYRNDNVNYPPNGGVVAGQPLVGAINNQTYMKKVPVAPGTNDGSCTSDSYTYSQDNSGSSYHITYCLGGAVQSAGPSSCEAVPGQICLAGGSGEGESSPQIKSPGTMADVRLFESGYDITGSWINIDNAKTSDNVYAKVLGINSVISYCTTSGVDDYRIRLVKGGAISGDPKQTDIGNFPIIDTYSSAGGATELWGLTLLPSDINQANFGVVYSISDSKWGEPSSYLQATNFNFSIPSDATINGVVVEIEKKADACDWFVSTDAYIDHIRLKVYYTN